MSDMVVVTLHCVVLADPEVGLLRRILELGLEFTARADQISEAAGNLVTFTRWLGDNVPPGVWERIMHWHG